MKVSIAIFIIYLLLSVSFGLFGEDSTKGLKITTSEVEDVKQTRDLSVVSDYALIKRWAIVIGVNDYEDKFIADLKKAQNDAKVISDVLKHEGQFDHVFTFTDDMKRDGESYPSFNNIVTRLEYLKSEIKPEDMVFFMFSGHGISDDDGQSYLLTADSKISEPYKTSLPLYEVQNWIDQMGVKRNIVVIDACRNNVEKSKAINTRTLINEKNNQAEISAIMYSTSPGEFSYEHDKEPYGVFTTYLINGLKGAADANKDVMISFNELRAFVETGVSGWALDNNKKQKPYTSVRGEFYGDLVMSVIPIHKRAVFNPRMITSSYRKMSILSNSLRYTGIAGMAIGGIGAITGGILGAVGLNQYIVLQKPNGLLDWNFYWNMYESGIYSAIALGAFAGVAIIPFFISFFTHPNRKWFNTLSFDVGFVNDDVLIGMRILL